VADGCRDDEPEVAGLGDLASLVLEGEDMVERVAKAHRATWGLGTADSWGPDQRTGVITWPFPDKTVTAPAQILGSHNATAGSWLWAWANQSILPELSVASETVRDWTAEHGHLALTKPKVEADEQKAAILATLAFRITRAAGFYRGNGVFITFGPVTVTAADGTTSTLALKIDDHDAHQRL
jgi:hypothetical protein